MKKFLEKFERHRNYQFSRRNSPYPISLISDRLINSFSHGEKREREREKLDQALSICMKFHFRFPSSFHSLPSAATSSLCLTRLSQFALACYWAVVYFGLIITSGANDSSGPWLGTVNREQRQRQREDGFEARKV